MSRGRGGPEGRDPWTLAAISAFVLAVLAIGGMWFAQRSNAAELEVRLEEAREDSTRLADLRVLSDSLIDRERQIRQRLELGDKTVKTIKSSRRLFEILIGKINGAPVMGRQEKEPHRFGVVLLQDIVENAVCSRAGQFPVRLVLPREV